MRTAHLAVVLVLVLVSAGCVGSWPGQPAPDSPAGEEAGTTATVTRVIDGDTIEIRYQNGTVDTVRLLGVDTPEVHKGVEPEEYPGIPDSLAGRDWLRNWGENASTFVKENLAGETVRVVVDPDSDVRGYYGRLLAYVYYDDGVMLNEELLRRGLARVYDSTFSKKEAFYALESEAMQNGVGLWGFGGADRVSASSVELAVVAIQADAPGNDNENPTGEYVTFRNTGDSTVDLSGFVVSDAANHEFVIPEGVTLAPGAELTVRSGKGTNTKSTLYWGSDRAIWNNGGDTITVRTATGLVVLEESYSSTSSIVAGSVDRQAETPEYSFSTIVVV
ncbi:lamin tail domain-containing protein [Haloarchaeobius sp. HME9146]|uniref:thermonuclease family protein n=1 Tax=Haloarchaeobius sp. HME9146 TaxID=2978732 RepID=UPI0021C23152|nr:lamin tail domain-containing protein [Haloarchaeobius sp. HME9146]MCT9098341.1 lamin tail domain-containing protein [Haloarchaeobius sp. HME9146]